MLIKRTVNVSVCFTITVPPAVVVLNTAPALVLVAVAVLMVVTAVCTSPVVGERVVRLVDVLVV